MNMLTIFISHCRLKISFFLDSFISYEKYRIIMTTEIKRRIEQIRRAAKDEKGGGSKRKKIKKLILL